MHKHQDMENGDKLNLEYFHQSNNFGSFDGSVLIFKTNVNVGNEQKLVPSPAYVLSTHNATLRWL